MGSNQQIETSVIASGATTGASYAASAGLLAAGAASGGALIGSVVPIVGTVIGALVGSLLSGHFARAAGAKNENAALNSIIPAVTSDIAKIFSALNAGTISGGDASSALDQIRANYWQAVANVESGAGQKGGPGTCSSAQGDPSYGPIGAPCNKSCTAACCIGCRFVENWVGEGKKLIAAGGGTRSWPSVGSNKYGFQGFPAFTITYTAPAAPLSSLVSGLPAGVATTLGLTPGGSGVPLWMWLAGGAAAYYFFVR